MPARILILDTVATNRIVLKVKMMAAHFGVDACSTRAEAENAISRRRPDLILLNLTDRSEDQHAFCKSLRNTPETAPIAVIAVGVADTAQARFAALDAGADDVMPHPTNDTLLLARIRSLLRVRSASQELSLRETTSRALGFEEARAPFETPAQIALITQDTQSCQPLLDGLKPVSNRPVSAVNVAKAPLVGEAATTPDLLVIDACTAGIEPTSLFSMVSDLRARAQTRLAAIMVVVPPELPETAAMFLDLGADDVFLNNGSVDELALRARALIHRKMQQDKLRDTLRNGLNAAVTDPLTGLFNRRYVEPHLIRMAAQSMSTRRNFAVMMLDIDHFKAINDTYGHAAGDQVLVQFAERLRENLRAIDLVARMGGEEFLVAMPRTSTRQAQFAADRLRRQINNTPFEIGTENTPVQITVSVGVAVNDVKDPDQPPLNALCDSADRALYVAKSAGRNRVKLSPSAA